MGGKGGASGKNDDGNTVHVACLCAAWCRLCDDYAPVLERVLAELALRTGMSLRRHWIDIEDDADLVGEFDVETFPTLVIVGPEGVRFAGPLTPQADTLQRLLRVTVLEAQPGAAWPEASPEVNVFAERLRIR